MVVVSTASLVSLVYFLLIRPQNAENAKLAAKTKSEQDKFQVYKNAIKQAESTRTALTEVSLQLGHAEDDVVSGDVYLSISEIIRRFKAAYHVEIPGINQPVIGEMDMLPNFPYKQVKVSLTGTAYYHDLGKFIADFENNFSHMRMVNLSLEPGGQGVANSERLLFRIDVVALVKPNT